MNSWQFSNTRIRRAAARTTAVWISSQAGVIHRGAAAGLRFDPGGTAPGQLLGTTELPIQTSLVNLLGPGDVFYDVGAHVGFFSIIGSRLVGVEGAVYAFEPVPRYAALIRANAASNGMGNVEVHELAVAARCETRELWLEGKASPPGTARLATDDSAELRGKPLRVAAVAIDDLVGADQMRPPTLVKVDVEGAELEVLSGMVRTMRTHRPTVICELHWTGQKFLEFVSTQLPEFQVTVLGERDSALTEYGHVLLTPAPAVIN